jgi:hypothetical protein
MWSHGTARWAGVEAATTTRFMVILAAAAAVVGCSAKEDMVGNPASGAGTTGEMPEAGGAAPADNTAGTASEGNAGGGDSGGPPTAQGGMGGSGEDPGAAGGAGTPMIDPEVMEMLDPNVDWTALTIIYPAMYSAYDGVHTFAVPARVDGATVELADWTAIPADAVTFDEDPEGGGVMITVQRAVPEIVIAVSSGAIGGTAPLFITEATPEDWARGEARYNNGVDYDLPMLNFADLINPDWVPPEPPDNLACNNCHTTGAKYFEIQHTPTQAARISDEDLITILSTGMKPTGIEFRVLPPMLEHLYVGFHTWEASEEEMLGLIVYMRSLTPTGQGDILLPDGTFGAP